MRELDVIESSASPWSSPIVLVNKKNGSCQVLHKDSCPLQCIDDTTLWSESENEILFKTGPQEWLLPNLIG